MIVIDDNAISLVKGEIESILANRGLTPKAVEVKSDDTNMTLTFTVDAVLQNNPQDASNTNMVQTTEWPAKDLYEYFNGAGKGVTFKSPWNHWAYTIFGIRPGRRSKNNMSGYWVLARRIPDGKMYRWSPNDLNSMLIKQGLKK
jgi:hypothetical protein